MKYKLLNVNVVVIDYAANDESISGNYYSISLYWYFMCAFILLLYSNQLQKYFNIICIYFSISFHFIIFMFI